MKILIEWKKVVKWVKKMEIDRYKIGKSSPVFIVAEIGINHNGDIKLAKELIDVAVDAGCDAVKFQKRTIEDVYTKEELDKPRESPWGTTNREQKEGLEFGFEEYKEINKYCKEKNILWFASAWDEKSLDFLEQFDLPCHKIASAMLTDDDFLKKVRATGKPVILSTGMSTMEQIEHAVDVLGKEKLAILHCTSTYPSKLEELNLSVIKVLEDTFNIPVGYSGHEAGITPTVAAVVLGACIIERHITLDRSMYGSDQSASVEPHGIRRLVRDVREVPVILGDGKKKIYDSEKPIIEKLRKK